MKSEAASMQFHDEDGRRKPKVSIGMPVYNGEKYLERALENILSQTCADFELIVSDNCSTDSSFERLCAHARRDPRIRLFRQDKNIGAARNFLYVLGQARGDYFMFAACDDGWDPRFVEKLAAVLDSDPAAGVAMSSFVRTRETGEIVDKTIFVGRDSLERSPLLVTFLKMMPVYLKPKPLHVLIYGLYRTSLIRDIMMRGVPDCICPDRIIMSEVVLSTRLHSVSDILHYRTMRSVPLKARYKGDPMTDLYSQTIALPKFLWLMLLRLLSSRTIPLSRKLLYVVPVWPFFVARYVGIQTYIQLREVVRRAVHPSTS